MVSNLTSLRSVFALCLTAPFTHYPAFSPESKPELQNAVNVCSAFSAECDWQKGPIGGWDVSRVTDMADIFNGATEFNKDLSKWDLSRVTDMADMFHDAFSFNQDLSKWNVSAVTNMADMFHDASSFNQDLSKWDVSAVYDMSDMFHGSSSFNQDLSKWNVSAVTNMWRMFCGASAFERKLCSTAWVTSKAHQIEMFFNSPGKISKIVCTKTKPGYLRVMVKDRMRIIHP